ncbi:MAG: O-antigen ligase family protein, partial [Eubacterium sp.]|nr:O-antigen ligase family protein [Eubacterium sp.]
MKSGLDEETDNGSIPLISVQDGQNIWNFTPVEDDIYIYNSFNRIDTLKDIQKSGFKNKYYFASRRGYIWSRTIPLLTEHLLIGTGPDNFVYTFPNDDYVGKKYMGYENQTITKPHDMYMQIWVQDGLPALLGFLALYVVFL